MQHCKKNYSSQKLEQLKFLGSLFLHLCASGKSKKLSIRKKQRSGFSQKKEQSSVWQMQKAAPSKEDH